MTAATVKPMRVYRRDLDLRTDVARTIGYRAVCVCGFIGHVFGIFSEALAEASWHNAEKHR